MDKKQVLTAIKQARKIAKKRNFKQSFDLIINLANLDLKKNENQLDDYVELHNTKGKKTKVCALVGTELEANAKKAMDKVVRDDEFARLDKKEVKKIAGEYDYFVAQANIMPKVAGTFGRFLGPRGRMPNPKAGCIVPPNANMTQVYERLQKTITLSTKKGASVKTIIGHEEMKDDDILDNIMVAYNHFVHILPQGANNVKSVMIKMTMGKAARVGGDLVEEEDKKTSKKVKKTKEEKQEKPLDKKQEKIKVVPKKEVKAKVEKASTTKKPKKEKSESKEIPEEEKKPSYKEAGVKPNE